MNSPSAAPLNAAELDRLDAWLDAAAGPITNAEAFDGFLVALVIGPDLVLPSQYLQLVFGAGKEDEEEASPGNAWAEGFLTGVDLSRKSWQSFINDDDLAGPPVPIFMLAHEHDPDPKFRPPPISPELRNELLIELSRSISNMHRHFLKQRRGTTASASSRIGRNAPCPCGSGRTYKRCRGRPN